MKRILGNIDKTIFGGSAAIYLALFLFIIMLPALAEKAIKGALEYTFTNFWALYCASGLAIAYFQYRRGLPNRISSCFEPMLGVWSHVITART